MYNRRGRPHLSRRIRINPRSKYFKPRGIPVSELDIVILKFEEVEALRLKNIKNLDQKECAKEMHTSPATIQRILSSAYHKISDALVNGKAIKIEENK